MGRDVKYDILINGEPLTDYGGCTLLDYSIGGTDVTNTVFLGYNRTNFALLDSVTGSREITLTVVFIGRDLHEAKLNRSRVNRMVAGKCELYIPDDGFYYSAYCTDLGQEELVGIGDALSAVKATYSFTGIRHGELVTVNLPANGTIFCKSTMPKTDCRLTATAPAAANAFTLGHAVFHDVLAGQILVFDGINGAVTKDGTNAAATTTFLPLPYIVPGRNLIRCTAPVTVEYYPTYI